MSQVAHLREEAEHLALERTRQLAARGLPDARRRPRFLGVQAGAFPNLDTQRSSPLNSAALVPHRVDVVRSEDRGREAQSNPPSQADPIDLMSSLARQGFPRERDVFARRVGCLFDFKGATSEERVDQSYAEVPLEVVETVIDYRLRP